MNTYKCSKCGVVFKGFYDLRKHAKKFHKEKLQEVAPLKKRCVDNLTGKKYNFRCNVCGRNFNFKGHLTFHQKTHGIFKKPASKKSTRICPLCMFKESSKTLLYKHFKNNHNIDLHCEEIEFSTKEDFEAWKNLIQQSSKSRVVKERGDSQYKSQKTLSYICHRSEHYVSESKGNRRLKTQGTRNIGGFCPSGMKVFVNSNSQYQVTYTKTHVGHTADLGHLNLSAAERKEIAAKIAMKIPMSHILNEVREKISEDSDQRIHLLTKKDLNNIAAAFNLQSEAVRHPNGKDFEQKKRGNQGVALYCCGFDSVGLTVRCVEEISCPYRTNIKSCSCQR